MAKKIKKRRIVLSVILLLAVLLLTFYLYSIFPRNKGNYSILDYERQIKIGYKPEKKYKEIRNYIEACATGEKVIIERFSQDGISRFDIYYRREVFYDSQSDTWLVSIFPADIDILDGGYSCIVSSDGTVISCWGN